MSRRGGQSWVTALGVVLDAAVLTCAVVPGAELREPYLMYRRGRRAQFDLAYQRVQATGLPVRDLEEAGTRLIDYRSTYGTTPQALIDHLLAPAGLRGHSAEDTADERPKDG